MHDRAQDWRMILTNRWAYSSATLSHRSLEYKTTHLGSQMAILYLLILKHIISLVCHVFICIHVFLSSINATYCTDNEIIMYKIIDTLLGPFLSKLYPPLKIYTTEHVHDWRIDYSEREIPKKIQPVANGESILIQKKHAGVCGSIFLLRKCPVNRCNGCEPEPGDPDFQTAK